MHSTQEKILRLIEKTDILGLTLREIGKKVGEPDSPQKIKHHLKQLAKKGLLRVDFEKKVYTKIKSGLVEKSNLISLPIMGTANCGEAVFFADDYLEGHLVISKRLLEEKLIKKIKDLFVIKAIGVSMNKAKINDNNIEEGDYVLINKQEKKPSNGAYILSVIDGMANIKKFFHDRKNHQFILMSESSEEFPPIFIHEKDFSDYLIAGKVVKVFKKP